MRTHPTTAEEIRERVLAKVIKYHARAQHPSRSADSCWLWQGSTCEGIGTLKVDGKIRSVRQVVWEAFGVTPPLAGRKVRLACGRKDCVNPKHLVADQAGKGGRTAKGRRNDAGQASLYR